MFDKKSTRDLVHQGESNGSAPAETGKPPKAPKAKKGEHSNKAKKERRPAKDLLRSKGFLGAISIAVGLVLALVVVPMISSRIAKTLPVVVAAGPIPAGTQITADMLTMREMGALNLPSSTLFDPKEAVGKFAAVAALPGDILTAGRMAEQFPSDDPELTTLPEGKLAMSATLADLAQSVSGKLRAGDIIQLFAVYENAIDVTQDYSSQAVPELQCVEVLAATNSKARDVLPGIAEEAAAESDRQIATVTLAVTRRQAAVLAGLDHGATLHAALVTRGSASAKADALALQDNFLETLNATPSAPAPTAAPGPAPTEAVAP